MTNEELQTLLKAGDTAVLKSTLETYILVTDLVKAFKQYNPQFHDVMDPLKRPDTVIKDDKGNVKRTVSVTRLALSIQKKIVQTAVQFLGAPEIQSKPKSEVEIKMTAGLKKIWDDNKMVYKFKQVVKRAMSEKQCAMLWYTQDTDPEYWEGTGIKTKFRFRLKILSPSLGDKLYPVFDEFGDMIAFGRAYEIQRVDKKVEYFDLETADKIYLSSNESGTWQTDVEVNEAGKIRVIYFESPLPWEDVNALISTLEEIISNHNMTNKKIGSPIIFAEGDVVGFPDQDETGKLLIGKNGAKVSYLTWNSAPESIKMEVENLFKFIYSLSSTPDISFENLKSLGYFSTIALKTLFIDAHLKAAENEEIFGEGAQRMINYQKTALAKLDTSLKPALPMDVKPVFTYFLPQNDAEEITNISSSLTAGIISQETAVKLNPLVTDPVAELVAIKAETGIKDQKALDVIKASKPSLLPEPAAN